MRRIVLSEENFKTLINGGIVKKDGIQIALSDIGYNVMIEMIINKKDDEVHR